MLQVDDTSVSLEVSLSEPGTVHVMVVPAGAPTPTPQQVIAGTDGSDAASIQTTLLAVGSAWAVIAGSVGTLPHDTAVDVYFVAEDAVTPSPNVMAAATVLHATTLPDGTPPQFQAGSPVAQAPSDSSVTLAASVSEAGRLFFVVVGQEQPPPSVTRVMNGEDNSGAPALASGAIDIGPCV